MSVVLTIEGAVPRVSETSTVNTPLATSDVELGHRPDPSPLPVVSVAQESAAPAVREPRVIDCSQFAGT